MPLELRRASRHCRRPLFLRAFGLRVWKEFRHILDSTWSFGLPDMGSIDDEARRIHSVYSIASICWILWRCSHNNWSSNTDGHVLSAPKGESLYCSPYDVFVWDYRRTNILSLHIGQLILPRRVLVDCGTTWRSRSSCVYLSRRNSIQSGRLVDEFMLPQAISPESLGNICP